MSTQLSKHRSKFKTSKTMRLKSALSYLLSDNSNIDTHYTYFGRTKTRVLIDAIRMSLQTRKRRSFIEKNFSQTIHPNEKFVYFPLGVDEERNQLISTPFYTNQIELIRSISKSLPIDYKLYVKETPDQAVRYWRPQIEYSSILEIPNVRIFHPYASSEQFLKNCSLVISAGGTSSFEAAFFGKPSIVFADIAYTSLLSVFHVKSYEQLPKIIQQALETTVSPNDLDRYLNFLENNTVDSDIFEIIKNYQQIFYFGGNLVNVEIESQEMDAFLQNNMSSFSPIIDEIVNKIKKYKTLSS